MTHDAKEPPLSGPDGQPLRGIGAGEFRIPEGLAGGQYTLHVAEAGNRFPAVQCKFIVHQWQAPRLNKEIAFDRTSYGPGDVVNISALCTPVEGAGQGTSLEATGRVVVDGKPWELQRLRVAPDGRIRFSYTLPSVAEMPRGNGIVSITFFDGGTQETVVRPIPIVLNKMFVDFYPEGGDLISGLPNRVYFQARTATDKPADLQGRIVDQAGAVVAKALTLTDNQEPGVNQGMGAFEFTPQSGQKYELKIDSPTGMHDQNGSLHYYLPSAKAEGVVLKLPSGVAHDTIDVEVTSAGKDRRLLVGAYCRGKQLDQLDVDARAGERVKATLRPSLAVGGVYRITVFDKQGSQLIPVAERLIFRKTAQTLHLAVTADKQVYYPGEQVRPFPSSGQRKKGTIPSRASCVRRRSQRPQAGQ